jgi:hypothetical protein
MVAEENFFGYQGNGTALMEAMRIIANRILTQTPPISNSLAMNLLTRSYRLGGAVLTRLLVALRPAL